MMFPNSMIATGALFRLIGPARDWVQLVHATTDLSTSQLAERGWLGMSLTSGKPLIPEAEIRAEYVYHFLFRPGAEGRFLITSTDTKLIEVLFDRMRLKRWVARPSVRIHDLVVSLCSKPAVYTLSAVHTRIEGFGQALRNAAFYGHDVGEAVLFRELLGRMQAHRVTLRDAAKRVDVMGIGQKGEVSFTYTGSASLREIDRALRFMSARGFLDWSPEDVTAGEHIGLE